MRITLSNLICEVNLLISISRNNSLIHGHTKNAFRFIYLFHSFVYLERPRL